MYAHDCTWTYEVVAFDCSMFSRKLSRKPHVGDESAALDNFAEACVQTGMFLIRVPCFLHCCVGLVMAPKQIAPKKRPVQPACAKPAPKQRPVQPAAAKPEPKRSIK